MAIGYLRLTSHPRTNKVTERILLENLREILLHSREKLVKEYLHRHVTSDMDLTSDEQILLDKYNLPLPIILSSKAQRAEYEKQWLHAVRLWIDARQWRRAHDAFCNHVFHDILFKGLMKMTSNEMGMFFFSSRRF